MLNNDDIDMLMQALDAFEAKDATNMVLSSLLGAAFSKDENDAKARAEKTFSKYESEERDRKLKRERIILLRAKLLNLRDSIEANEFERDVLKK